MRQAGVRIAMGTDIHNVPEMGFAARELELYVDNGMSPLEAISSATRDAASALGLGADLGTIEAGKVADIIAVRGNPATDIGVLQHASNITLVIKEGRLYVDRMAATPRLVRHCEPGQWKIIDREERKRQCPRGPASQRWTAAYFRCKRSSLASVASRTCFGRLSRQSLAGCWSHLRVTSCGRTARK